MQHAQRQSLIGRENELEQLEGGLAECPSRARQPLPPDRRCRHRQDAARRGARRTGRGRGDARGLGALLGEPRRAGLLALVPGAAGVDRSSRGRASWSASSAAARTGSPRSSPSCANACPASSRSAGCGRSRRALPCSTRSAPSCATSANSDPLLVVLDDLHAADRESLALLDFVVRSLSEIAHRDRRGAYQEAAAHARPEVEKLFGALGIKGRHLALGGMAESTSD